jgi:hypothetical protein
MDEEVTQTEFMWAQPPRLSAERSSAGSCGVGAPARVPPDGCRMEASVEEVDPFSFVPAIRIEGNLFCGSRGHRLVYAFY